MQSEFQGLGIGPGQILLPEPGTDLAKFAVVACDQFSAQPEYWEKVREIRAEAPSALDLIYPEAWLPSTDERIAQIVRDSRHMVLSGALTPAVECGFVLVERQTTTGIRLGLVCLADLELYDFGAGSRSPIRPTEGTILERIPPRVRIRRHAAAESPHVMLLADDPKNTLLPPLYVRRHALRPLYDFDLMLGGGHIRGWAVERESDIARLHAALASLVEGMDGLHFAVGDGNHSLATARQCWLDMKQTLSPEARQTHPARYALVELVNLNDPSLVFEPIHRLAMGTNGAALFHGFSDWLQQKEALCGEGGQPITYVDGGGEHTLYVNERVHPLAVGTLMGYLDGVLSPRQIEYIHGEQALRTLALAPNACGFLLPAMEKSRLFPGVRAGGALPRKTFSMGEAQDKRYYLECRSLLP